LRSSLFTTPLGYKAMYSRSLLEGMLVKMRYRNGIMRKSSVI
jgi:hypothetical protein